MGSMGVDLLRRSHSGDSHLLFSAIENLLLSVKLIFNKKKIGSLIASQFFFSFLLLSRLLIQIAESLGGLSAEFPLYSEAVRITVD